MFMATATKKKPIMPLDPPSAWPSRTSSTVRAAISIAVLSLYIENLHSLFLLQSFSSQLCRVGRRELLDQRLELRPGLLGLCERLVAVALLQHRVGHLVAGRVALYHLVELGQRVLVLAL